MTTSPSTRSSSRSRPPRPRGRAVARSRDGRHPARRAGPAARRRVAAAFGGDRRARRPARGRRRRRTPAATARGGPLPRGGAGRLRQRADRVRHRRGLADPASPRRRSRRTGAHRRRLRRHRSRPTSRAEPPLRARPPRHGASRSSRRSCAAWPATTASTCRTHPGLAGAILRRRDVERHRRRPEATPAPPPCGLAPPRRLRAALAPADGAAGRLPRTTCTSPLRGLRRTIADRLTTQPPRDPRRDHLGRRRRHRRCWRPRTRSGRATGRRHRRAGADGPHRRGRAAALPRAELPGRHRAPRRSSSSHGQPRLRRPDRRAASSSGSPTPAR